MPTGIFGNENSELPIIQLSLFQKHKEDFTPGVLLPTHLQMKNFRLLMGSCKTKKHIRVTSQLRLKL